MSNYISNEFLTAETFNRPADKTPENLINLAHHKAARDYIANGKDSGPGFIFDEQAPALNPFWQDVKDSLNPTPPAPLANALERARRAIRRRLGIE